MSNHQNPIRQSLLAILPGIIITLLGLTLWIASATLLYQIALPVMGFGGFFMLIGIARQRNLSGKLRFGISLVIVISITTLFLSLLL